VAMVLDGANVGRFLTGMHHEGVAEGDRSTQESAGHYGAHAFDGEGAIDGEEGFLIEGRGREFAEGGKKGFLEGLEPIARVGGNGDDGGVGVGRVLQAFAHELGGEFDVLGDVAFGESDDDAGDSEVVEDVEVFFGLGHPAVVGRDGKEGEVHSAHSGDHVADEIGVAGDVDDAQFVSGSVALVVEREVGKAEFDGDPALFLLRQAVGIGPGEDAHQG